MPTKPQPHSTIYLMRHGQAAKPGQLVGQHDIGLSPEGRAQIEAWAEFFAPIPISAIWSSPLSRARESAAIIMKAMNKPIPLEHLQIVDEFKEISLGEWEGQDKNTIRQKYPREWEERGSDFMNCAPPGGESFNALSRRALPAMQRLYSQIIEHRHVLIMAHQAVNRAILAGLGEPFSGSWLDIAQDTAALNELELTQKRSGAWNCNIIRVNAHAPLWLR